MLSNQKVQFFIFFVLVAVVYAVGYKEFLFYSYGPRRFFVQLDYPLLSLRPISHRLVDLFYGNVYNTFYYTFIYGLLYKPFFGELHFLDIQVQAIKMLWASIFSGVCLLSILFTRLFVRLNIWHWIVYALLFYLFFVHHDSRPSSLTRIIADDLTFFLGLCFLYPVAHYVLTQKDPFSNWNPWTATSFMVILCYVAYFTIMWAIMLVSIGLLVLWLIHLSETYQREDFKTIPKLMEKLKQEPKWFLISSLFSSLMACTVVLISLSSFNLINKLADIRNEHLSFSDKFDLLAKPYNSHIFELKLNYDDKQIAFFVIIFLCLFGSWLYRRWHNKKWGLSQVALKRVGFLLLGVLLFSIFTGLITIIVIRHYFYAWETVVRFILVTGTLGLGFHFLQKNATKPLIALLFFIFSFGAVRTISSLENKQNPNYYTLDFIENSYYINNATKMAINLGYTFSCYGERRVPFYNKPLTTNEQSFLPNLIPDRHGEINFQKFKRKSRVFQFMTKARSSWRFKKLRNDDPLFLTTFYYEPSINKINAKLAELQRTRPWRCTRVKNDIYRVDKLGY